MKPQKSAYVAPVGLLFKMSAQQSEARYSYRFTLEARRPDSGAEEPSKAEVQAYINEILGVRKDTKEKQEWASV